MSQIDLQWFAAEDEGRTEEPSEYKLRKARDEGRVPKSSDLNSSVVFFFCLMMLFVLAKRILFESAEVFRFFFKQSSFIKALFYVINNLFLSYFK